MGINNSPLEIIGSTDCIEVAGIKDVPAKIDTGADSSSIWASSINMGEDGVLSFVLFGKKSPLYTGERIMVRDYSVKTIRSSHGDEQIRYLIKLPITIKNQSFDTEFTLANRSRNNFPVLIGRRTLEGKFMVDVSRRAAKINLSLNTKHLNRELKKNPYKFHQKYLAKKKGGL